MFEWVTFVIVHVAMHSFIESSLFLEHLLLPTLIVGRIRDLILSVHCLHTAAPLLQCPSNAQQSSKTLSGLRFLTLRTISINLQQFDFENLPGFYRLSLPALIIGRIGDLILSVYCMYTVATLIQCPSNVQQSSKILLSLRSLTLRLISINFWLFDFGNSPRSYRHPSLVGNVNSDVRCYRRAEEIKPIMPFDSPRLEHACDFSSWPSIGPNSAVFSAVKEASRHFGNWLD